MSVADFSLFIKSQLEGVSISELIECKKRTPITLANADKSERRPSSISTLRQTLVLLPDDSLVALDSIADLSIREGPQLMEREKGSRFGAVRSNVAGRDIVGFVEELAAAVEQQLELPIGYSVAFGGEFENQRRATNNLLMVVPAALGLVMLILFTTFQSFSKAVLILVNIPFALMGGVIALFISGEYLSVPASVGLIALLGVAVLNGVVMLSYFEQINSQGADFSARVTLAAGHPLRPVLMTATTAMFGLLPLVFATGPGVEVQKPLAVVVVGGLLSSTLTTLYLLPYLYCRTQGDAYE